VSAHATIEPLLAANEQVRHWRTKLVHELRARTEDALRARRGRNQWSKSYEAGRTLSAEALIDDLDHAARLA
jgi:hypothetical protein